MVEEIRMTVRLPRWAADYLDAIGDENFTSRNAEIVRSIKERMQATAGEKFGDRAPAVVVPNTAVDAASQFHPQHQEC